MFQEKVFSKIIQQFETQSDALDAMSKVLYLDKSSVHRRVTGGVTLKIEELEKLTQHFKLSLDELLYKQEDVYLGQNLDNSTSSTITEMFDLKRLEVITQLPNFKGYIWGSTISIEHFYTHPEIPFFKLHVWDRLTWRSGKYKNFNLNLLTSSDRETITTFYKHTHRFDTVEFFHKLSLDLILEQIRYAFETNAVSKKDTNTLLDCLQASVNLLEKKVAIGSKLLTERKHLFEVYYSEQPLTGTAYLCTSPVYSNIINSLIPPQLVLSHDTKLIQKGLDFVEKLKSRSIKISGEGEATRRKLFNHYRRCINRVRLTIE